MKCFNISLITCFACLFSILVTMKIKSNFFFSQYIRMEMKTSKSIVLKYNMKNLMTKLLPMVKKISK